MPRMSSALRAVAAGVVALAFAATPTLAQDKRTLSIATGGTGGVYYPLGGGLANLLSKHVPGWQATAEVTGGSVDNLKLVGAGKADIAFTMADASLDAAKGEDKFKGAAVEHRALMVLYPNIMHVVTVDGSGINTLRDLKGKRVSTGSPGSATEVMAFRVIEAAGLDRDKDLRRERLGVAESTNAIKDKKIDAYFWVGGLPTAAVTDLAATPGTKIRILDHAELAAPMNQKHGQLYSAAVIPAGTYPGQDKATQSTAVWNILVAPAKMPDDVAYNIVKTLIERKPEMVAVHKQSEDFDLKNQKVANTPVPFHPGALRFFAERGVATN
ncbi:MAG: TAXI family TRAP transporter solute-binding subunit [Alphaproteobacteria bacterium]|nr:TAXI family TRAP transporter solute-binding subunit [Alphaproteobacteria bacterium]